MKKLPYGYHIADGKVVIDEEKAKNLKKIADAYLSGMSFVAAAETVGLRKSHSVVKQMLQNPRYLGNKYYPAILTEETMCRIEEERLKREKHLGRDRKEKKVIRLVPIETEFTSSKPEQKYEDPILQAEYVYSLIERKVNT